MNELLKKEVTEGKLFAEIIGVPILKSKQKMYYMIIPFWSWLKDNKLYNTIILFQSSHKYIMLNKYNDNTKQDLSTIHTIKLLHEQTSLFWISHLLSVINIEGETLELLNVVLLINIILCQNKLIDFVEVHMLEYNIIYFYFKTIMSLYIYTFTKKLNKI